MNPPSFAADRVAAYRQLHASGCFLLPNPWDVGSAVYLAHLGFQALATSSAGLAFTKGLPDAAAALTREATLAHIREVAAATPLPVNADFQSGFGADPDQVAESVTLCVETGAAGLSIEDASGDPAAPLFERRVAVQRVRAARSAVDASGVPVVLTARCEAWLVGHPDAPREALARLVEFADAGADCLYAPGVRDLPTIEAIVKAVSPKPVNVLVGWPSAELTVARLAGIGVRRVSLGSALARVAWGSFIRAAQAMVETGTFGALADAAPFADLNAVFAGRGQTRTP